ncbi:hypothetical protein DFH11DRAFT_1616415 [Phellopilus nigrolimitatus]|nr:hypothetical protein DFH11DRAFT_1616415 [Phellopilus nigrolimitatus]
MTQDELDTCRICSAPAEPDAPLFHPCKCSGTIRYIHQDCLTTWLAHSKKKTCDVCKYQYSFTKVYSPNMPKQIPFILFLRKFAQQIFWGFVMGLRGLMVATIWLAFLPYVTVWTWRFYFIMGENIAWWINDRPRPTPSPIFYSYYANVTVADDQNRTDTSNRTILGLATSYPVWRALSSDIFTGQIIASLIVLVFLGIFLLREWIMQNARPGVFEDNDIAGLDVQDGAEDIQQPQVQPNEQAEAPPPPVEVLEAQQVEQIDALPAASSSTFPEAPLMRFPENNGSIGSSDTVDVPDVPENEAFVPPRSKRRLHIVNDRETNREFQAARFRTWPRARGRVGSSSYVKGKGRARRPGGMVDMDLHESPRDTSLTENLGEHPDDFEFTFSVDTLASTIDDNASLSQFSARSFSFNPPSGSSELFQYKPASLPFPLTPNDDTSDPSCSSSGLRRPPLPSIILSAPLNTNDDSSASALVSPMSSPSVVPRAVESNTQPLSSPSLATYRAPEELDSEAGSSQPNQTEYFDDRAGEVGNVSAASSVDASSAESAFKEDFDEYFREESEESDADGEEWDEHAEVEPGLLRVEGEARNVRVNEDPNPPPVVEVGQAPDVAEEQDAINEDDVDGALEEAIGMRGPLTTVFQNAALMIFVLDTTIGIAVWLPFTIGKTTALLSLEPVRIWQILQWPISAIRYLTDPVVDSCFFLFKRAVLPLFKIFFSQTSVDSSIDSFNPTKTLLDAGFFKLFISRSPDSEDSAIVRGIGHVSNSPVAHFLEPYFARLGKRVRLDSVVLKSAWIELANGDASVNKFFAVVLGYGLVGLLVALYLNVLNVGSVQSAGRAIRNAIRQQLIVLKVAVFIVIELCIFPLGCGVMLDFCTLQLFPDTTFRSRMSFFAYAPVTGTFYHWMIGTMFMYQFAILLSGCRKIMRAGAMWFIKDPQDQNFHPIRDILDRPTLTQLRKLAISAVMYSIVVALGMGGLVFSLRLWGRVLLPLRWKLREPLSDIPIDLLFLHIVMPSTIKYFRPRKLAHALASHYWKWAARQLRLTSYMFGGLHPEEMRPSAKVSAWLSPLLSTKQVEKPSNVNEEKQIDGSYRRVPAQDNIALPREIKATVAVDELGNPLDEAGQRLMEIQNSEAEKAKRDVKTDYALVYLPPRFRERIILFILSLWLVGSSLFVAALAAPILLGRAVFGLVLSREVHDGYSIVVGFYLLWGCYYFSKTLNRMDRRRQRFGGVEPRGEWAVYVFKRSMLWAGNFVWVTFWLGVVIPTLVALVMDVYIVHPLRVMVKPDLTLEIRIFDSWAIGLLYTKMALSTMRFRPETRVDAALNQMKDNGWRRLDAVAVTFDIIAPVTAGLLAMLFLPIFLVLGLQRLLPTTISPNTLFLYVYPGIFVAAACARMYAALQTLCGTWAQQIRDSEFLVEMRLRNLEAASNAAAASTSTSSVTSPGGTPGRG